jgi:hypothetical protein
MKIVYLQAKDIFMLMEVTIFMKLQQEIF